MKPDFDKMNLIPAIIQDYKTKQVLMLAYVNKESYDNMIKTGRTCFYSRSRKALWQKGETSGNYQNIKAMYLDCDKDTLLIFVEQLGNGACHTGSYSCFFNGIIEYSEGNIENILNSIYNEIADRDINPVENSYTNYLLKEGKNKICKKIGEEATETVIAALSEGNDELIGEISDLIYHTLVLMYNKKVTLEDIQLKLEERHKIKGNKKQFNKRGEF